MANFTSFPMPASMPSSDGSAPSWVYLYHLSRSPVPAIPTYIFQGSVCLTAFSFSFKRTATALLDPVTIAAVAVTVGFITPLIRARTDGKIMMQNPITKGRKSG
ncbi:hypothetical protein D3C85_1395570 [compost metagenome]